ncbi:GAF and ANTAR domain-containing protein [Rhodococcus sp. C26F]
MIAFSSDRLSRIMAELARSFDDAGTDLDATLQRITVAAAELIPGTDSADILIITGRGKFESHAATSQLSPQIDSLQARAGQGPCVDAAMDTTLVRSDDLTTETRWPQFTAAAVDAGVRSILSFRLYTHDMQAGALNLFSMRPNAFDAESVHIGEALSAHAAIAFVAARREQQLHSAIASRDLIGQAKGMLMERFAVGADRAFAMMITLSQETNLPVATIAARIVECGSQRD